MFFKTNVSCNDTLDKIVPITISLLTIVLISSTINLSLSSSDLSWSSGEKMPTKRLELCEVALDGKIYLIGGMNRKDTAKSTVEVYDPGKNKWASVSPLPEKLNHPAADTYNGKIYVVGGFNGSGHSTNFLFIYDPLTNKWEQGKNMPTARAALTAKFVNGTLYAIGGDGDIQYNERGIYNPQGVVNTNEAYDPKNNSWSIKAPMPTPRDHLTSAVVNEKIYVIGGRQPWGGPLFKDLDKNEMYDPSADTWSTLEPLPTNRSGMPAAVVDGKIYVLGGESIREIFYENEKYDPINNSWTQESPMPTPRHGFGAVAIGNKIYTIAGGPQPGGDGSQTNEIYHVN
jgi:N-acetylneuraminic acid mutarotase